MSLRSLEFDKTEYTESYCRYFFFTIEPLKEI